MTWKYDERLGRFRVTATGPRRSVPQAWMWGGNRSVPKFYLTPVARALMTVPSPHGPRQVYVSCNSVTTFRTWHHWLADDGSLDFNETPGPYRDFWPGYRRCRPELWVPRASGQMFRCNPLPMSRKWYRPRWVVKGCLP